MSITVVQTSSEMVVSSGSSGTMTLNGVAGGNLLVSQLTQETDGTTFATNTDTNSGSPDTWLKDIEKANVSQGSACIQSAQNVVGGNTVVTVTLTGGVSKTYRGRLHELSGCVTTGVDTTDSVLSDPGGTTHHCSAAGINPSGGCIVFTSSAANSSTGTTTAGSGYTKVTTAGSFTHWQYQIFVSAPTSERGTWTSVSSPATNGAIAAYTAAAAGAGPTYPQLERGIRGLNRGLYTGAA